MAVYNGWVGGLVFYCIVHCVSVKKRTRLICVHNLCKCWPICKKNLPTGSQENCLCILYWNFHLTFIMLLHYLAKLDTAIWVHHFPAGRVPGTLSMGDRWSAEVDDAKTLFHTVRYHPAVQIKPCRLWCDGFMRPRFQESDWVRGRATATHQKEMRWCSSASDRCCNWGMARDSASLHFSWRRTFWTCTLTYPHCWYAVD